MFPPIAIILISGGTKHDLFPAFVLACVVLIGLIQVGAKNWPDLVTWLQSKGSRKWPMVPAVIDIATTVSWEDDVPLAGAGVPSAPTCEYKALLTYSYCNPELQSGDYSRVFGTEDDAKDWADACKGLRVMVHVDPRDPAHSVLRAEDIDAALARTSDTRG